eukprot:TRINITY_DN29450_c0_g1_i1.p1 TRINITY_DN29450_c0_g1~~TRINITY_DN29450_c0_g1_i1.p1  ORF type:complete len:226 (+),score=28.09 TRINITY_DN29450_c0_g1_i1:214-891(+)
MGSSALCICQSLVSSQISKTTLGHSACTDFSAPSVHFLSPRNPSCLNSQLMRQRTGDRLPGDIRKRSTLRSSSDAGEWTTFSSEDLAKEESKAKGKFNIAELREKLAKLGPAAVLAYGLFDGLTYTTFFVLAFLSYEKTTGKNPAANLKALLGIVVLMWTGNNVTRPFRVAGAAALAPMLSRGIKRLKEGLKLPSLALAYGLAIAVVFCTGISIVGLLILSRLGK